MQRGCCILMSGGIIALVDHIFVADKAGWYDITDELPQFEGVPPKHQRLSYCSRTAGPVPRAASIRRAGARSGRGYVELTGYDASPE